MRYSVTRSDGFLLSLNDAALATSGLAKSIKAAAAAGVGHPVVSPLGSYEYEQRAGLLDRRGQHGGAPSRRDDPAQRGALVEEINAAIEQTEAQASELDRLVDVFTLAETERGGAAARPAATGPQGVRALQDKVRTAARSYPSQRNVAVDAESTFDAGALGSRR